MFISEPQREIKVTGEYDVIVAGGGVAGISAALAAARQNKKVLLIEKMFMLGGLATAGLVTIYLPLCDGNGRQVSFGIAEELLRLSVKHGYEPFMDGSKDGSSRGMAWITGDEEGKKKNRFEVQFNANVFAILCEQLLKENGVDILYGTSVCAVNTENNKITHVITENKSGREAYKGFSFVDASGDADLCALSGAKTEILGQGNVLASWYYETVGDEYQLKMLGFSDIPDKYKEKEKIDNRKRYTGLDGKELSEMTFDSHDALLKDFLKKGGISQTHALTNIASIPQLRMTRRINGAYTMNDEEVFKSFPDSIGMISDWRKAGTIYEIPFRCLYGEEIKNLITCGRIISVTDDMWDITRVIPVCAVTGEAAGVASAMSDDFKNIDKEKYFSILRNNGVKLHITEL